MLVNTAKDRLYGTALACAFSLFLAASAAADSPKSFSVPAGELAAALQWISKQSGIELLFDKKQIKGVHTKGVNGTLTSEQAIRKLLEGTNLELSTDESTGAMMIGMQSGPDGSDTPTADVGASAHRSSAASIRLTEVQGENTAGDGSMEKGSMAQAGSADSAQAASAAKVQEIIVTATKRQERLQDVPISIGVITADEIDRRGLVGAADYLRGIPGANQSEAVPGQSIVIRGLEANTIFQGTRGGETTGTYFGETPLTATGGSLGSNVDVKLVDVERVEVLRGPQGTAFGSASLGGTVRIIPVAPKLNEFEGKFAAGYSVTSGAGAENHMLQGVGNFPLIQDRLAIRGTAYVFSDSGYYNNRAGSNADFQSAVVIPNGVQAYALDENEVGAYYVKGARISALFQASENLRFTLGYLTQENETDGIPVATSGPYEQTALRVASQDAVRGQTLGATDSGVDIVNAVMEYDLGWGSVLATYSHLEANGAYSRPFTTIGFNIPFSQLFETHPRSHVAELRFATALDGQWNFLAGAYFEDREVEEYFDQINFSTNTVNGRNLSSNKSDQKAVFGEVSWNLLPKLTLTGGVRAFEVNRSGPVPVPGFIQVPANSIVTLPDFKESDVVFRTSLGYKPTDDSLLYASWSQGFRPGRSSVGLGAPGGTCDVNGDGIVDGTNVSLDSTRSVNSDGVDNYEIGAKFAALGRLTVDTAIFVMDWSDVPVTNFLLNSPCPTAGYLVNAGIARSKGIELQASFQATDALRLDVGGSHIEAEITEGLPSQGFPAGNLLPGAPKVSANFAVHYDFQIADRPAFLRADAIYVASFYGDLQNSPVTEAGDYAKLNVTARVAINNLNLDLYVRNLTNEDIFTSRGAYGFAGLGGPDGPYGYQMRPRTVGMQIGYEFR